jgi:hypothetical protein
MAADSASTSGENRWCSMPAFHAALCGPCSQTQDTLSMRDSCTNAHVSDRSVGINTAAGVCLNPVIHTIREGETAIVVRLLHTYGPGAAAETKPICFGKN